MAGARYNGREGLERIVLATVDAGLHLVRRGPETISSEDGAIRVAVPVLELAGGTQIHGTATFDISDGKISRFEVSSELLRN